MTTLRRRILLRAFMVFGLAVMTISFVLATVLEVYELPSISLAQFLEMRIRVQNFVAFGVLLLAWHVTFSSLGLYNSKRLSARWAEIGDIIKATAVGCGIIFAISGLLRIRMVTPLFMLLFWAVSTAAEVSSRLALRFLLENIRSRGRNLRQMLVIGTNPRAVQFARRVEARPELGYRIAGFVDREWAGNTEFQGTGYALVSDFDGLPEYLRHHVVDEAMIALPMESCYGEASHVAALCEEQGIIVRLLSDIFNLRLARSRPEEFEGEAVMTLASGTHDGWPQVCKRTLDVALSLTVIVICAPLFALAAILVKLTSAGPIFFIQERVGLNKRRFHLYKFRTMVARAEELLPGLEQQNEMDGPVFKIKKDPRLTRLGRILRKSSIDELPQLFNVLVGEMSLVGPRPLPVRDYNGFNHDWQRRRFSVRPGITCLWQINGRNSVPFERWMELDLEYIDHWSLGLDLKILAKTIPAVLKGSGAA